MNATIPLFLSFSLIFTNLSSHESLLFHRMIMTESLAAVKVIMTIGIDDKNEDNYQRDNNDDDDISGGREDGDLTTEKMGLKQGKSNHGSSSCLRAVSSESCVVNYEKNQNYHSEDENARIESKGEEDGDFFADNNDSNIHDNDDDDNNMEINNNNYIIMKKNVNIMINTNTDNTDNTKIPQVGEKEENVQKLKNNEIAKTKRNISSNLILRENPLVFSSSKTNMFSNGHDHDHDHDVIPIVAPSTTDIENMKNKIALCNAHVLASTAGIARLKALIEKDALHLSLVIHEPEIWRR